MFGYVLLPCSFAAVLFLAAINVIPASLKKADPSLKLAIRLVREVQDDLLWAHIGKLGGVCHLCEETWLELQELREHTRLSRSWYRLLLRCLRLYTVAVYCNYVEAPLRATVLPVLPRQAARITYRIYTEINKEFYEQIANC